MVAQPPSNPLRWQAQYTQVYFEDFEGSLPGLQLVDSFIPPGQVNSSVLTMDPSLVIAGKASARLGWFGKIVTNPSTLPLGGNTTYIVEFQYHILNYGAASDILHLDLQPVGTTDPQLQVNFAHMNLNAPATGTFSAGGLLASASNYVLTITAQQQTDVVIDNLAVYRQDSIPTSTQPPTWARLETLPFPRLGKYQGGTVEGYAATAPAGSPYTPSYIESTMPFFDITFGVPVYQQTQLPDATRRARLLNPNAVILPYRISEEQDTAPADMGSITNSNVNLDYQFLNSLSPDWYLRDTEGNIVFEQHFPAVASINLSSHAPLVNGATYLTSLVNWLDTSILPSGMWDGIFFDNLWGSTNADLLNYSNPALIDIDIDRNGTRATPAQVSEMTRSGATSLLQQFRQSNGDQQLIIANVGAPGLAAYVNGFLSECVNYRWNSAGTTNFSPMAWRAAFDAYRGYEVTTRLPRVNTLEGCGPVYAYSNGTANQYALPTAADIVSHRFTMGTSLLSDGFYAFDLHGCQSPPLWYDEYSVDSTGTAVQDLTDKGYLGQALSDAMELASPASVLLQEGFEGTTLPASLVANPGPGTTVTISQNPGEVISGSGSLVLSNPNHTALGGVSVSSNPSVIQFTAGNSYLLTFDWRVLETVDGALGAAISTNPSQPLDVYTAPGNVAGDSGTAYLPFVIPSAGQWSIGIYIVNGGKVAIDNMRITQGGIGPWRRDFENGLVLVNPLPQPHTFSSVDLSGDFQRTGIHRIKGTQAPDVNNGQAVAGSLTLGAFDAVILLADHLTAPTSIAIQTSPTGLQFSVDGGALQTAPQALSLTVGTHSIAVATTQAGGAGIQDIFTTWNDGGAATHEITVTSSPATYTASFNTRYQLTTAVSPTGSGSVTPGGGFYDSGSGVPINAVPNGGYAFSNWTGSVASPGSASTTVTMAGPMTVTANFTAVSNHPAFFSGEANLGGGIYYLQFQDGNPFGYYTYAGSGWTYHFDMGYEYVVPTSSGSGVYLWDLASGHWWYTNSSQFPYLYDFTLNTWMYYFPDTKNAGRYTTNPRYFDNLTSGQIFTM
jgi:hypothetical protein